MQDGYWAIRKYTAGPIGETYKFWVPGKKPARMTASAKAGIRKQAQNAQNAVKTLARLLNENFRAGDYLLGLDYDEESYKRLEMALHNPSVACGDSSLCTREPFEDLWYAGRDELARGLRRGE